MKFKLRRFVFMLVFAVLFSYVGDKSLTLAYALLGGVAVGYLFHWEDRNWVHKNDRHHRNY